MSWPPWVGEEEWGGNFREAFLGRVVGRTFYKAKVGGGEREAVFVG